MASKQLPQNPSSMTPLANGLGAAKDKTKDFLATKIRIQSFKDPSARFQPTTKAIAFDQFMPTSSAPTSSGASKQASHFSTRSSSQSSLNQPGKTTYDELGYGKDQLPPLWVDIQESIEEKVSEVDEKFEKLKTLRAQRFKPKFDEEENQHLDEEINELVASLTNIIKKSEADLKKMMTQQFDNECDLQIRSNIQQKYVNKLQEITRQLRSIEKEHLIRVQNLYGKEGEIFLNKLEKQEADFFADLQQEQKQKDLISLDHFDELANQRSEGIDRVVNQMNDLAVLFKELSNLVIEQGTVLDRIDYNIEHARTNVKKGNEALDKTLKRESSWRAKGCISCQVATIMICAALLVLKHA